MPFVLTECDPRQIPFFHRDRAFRFYNPPQLLFDRWIKDKGSLCHASPSMCLQCRNAIVFRDHLPRLIAYREALDAIENNTPPRVFSEIYGQQRVNIDAIVAEFPPEQIESAREANIHLHHPLGQRAEQ